MKPAATKIKHVSNCVRLLLGGCLLASLLACNDGGGGGGGGKTFGNSKDPDNGGPSTSNNTSSSGSSSSSGSGGTSSSGGGSMVLEDVVWKELVNTSVVDGDTLKKTGGCDGCLDAGAESRQFTAAGNGYLEFTVNDVSRIRYIGLNPNSTVVRPTEITFGLKIVSGHAEVKEDGQYKADTTISVGDVLRIEAQSGVVTYAKNGKVFYTSAVTMNLPFQVDTAMISMGGAFTGVRMTVADEGEADAAAASAGNGNVTWTDLVNVAASGNSLRKTGGCDGCEDAGAVSRQQLTAGSGYLDFTVGETGPALCVGLNGDGAGTGVAQMPFAIKLVNDTAEVREYGVYRAGIAVGSGDVLRIAVQAGVVSYSRNGAAFYTSDTAASYPLRADASLISSGSVVNNLRVAGFSGK
ncbi:MAG TPA: hypothetical protein VFX02_02375 [Gammaproteobacteria bacterium]|nr:hypothetical protein [Gammaproteobacteria bacterium]